MKKSILNLVGAQKLTKSEQKEVNGGAQNYCMQAKNCADPACRKYYTVEECFGTPIERP
ncbi:hypothetical protein [Flavobacterium sp.]|uniref:hypothetical protein n=1 Tax=Flavobacterium sp. TaxID=239 RepID=UPI002630FE92|nr:hypothetical protein [Flavobacterium sp.]